MIGKLVVIVCISMMPPSCSAFCCANAPLRVTGPVSPQIGQGMTENGIPCSTLRNRTSQLSSANVRGLLGDPPRLNNGLFRSSSTPPETQAHIFTRKSTVSLFGAYPPAAFPEFFMVASMVFRTRSSGGTSFAMTRLDAVWLFSRASPSLAAISTSS